MENEKTEIKTKKSNKEYISNFYFNNPEKLTEKIICEFCGGEYTYNNKSKHMKSKRHIEVTNFIKNKIQNI